MHVFDPTGNAELTLLPVEPAARLFYVRRCRAGRRVVATAAGESHTDADVRFREQLGAKLLVAVVQVVVRAGAALDSLYGRSKALSGMPPAKSDRRLGPRDRLQWPVGSAGVLAWRRADVDGTAHP